ncbi:MAG: transcriptional regulator [Bacteroidota bacterium]
METTTINQDIRAFYVTASSFPDGVLAAHQQLHAIVPFDEKRRYFGLSRPENDGGIVYHAAAEEIHPGEAEELGFKMLVLKKGTYVSVTIEDFMKDIPSIERAFKELLSYPQLDPEGYCVELYLNQKDVQCMIRLAD